MHSRILIALRIASHGVQLFIGVFINRSSPFEAVLLHIQTDFHFTDNIPSLQWSNNSRKRHSIRNTILIVTGLLHTQEFIPIRKIIFRINRKNCRTIRKSITYCTIKNSLISQRTLDYVQSHIIIEIEFQPFIRRYLKFSIYIIFTQIILYLIQQTFLIGISHTNVIVEFIRTSCYIQVMRMADSRFLKIIIKPISIGIYRILRTGPSCSLLIRFYTRKFC